MPNNTSNSIEIIADDEVVKKILADIKGGEKEDEGHVLYIDFEKIVPIPELVEGAPYSPYDISMESRESLNGLKEVMANGLKYEDLTLHLEGPIGKIAALILKEDKPSDEITDEVLMDLYKSTNIEVLGHYFLEKEFGVSCKYYWLLKYWGTKGGAYGSSMSDENTIAFNTAWSGCESIVIALSKKYPEAKFRYKTCDEQTGVSCADLTYQNGEQIEGIEYDNLSKEAFEFAFELAGGKDYFTYSEEQGTYIYYD